MHTFCDFFNAIYWGFVYLFNPKFTAECYKFPHFERCLVKRTYNYFNLRNMKTRKLSKRKKQKISLPNKETAKLNNLNKQQFINNPALETRKLIRMIEMTITLNLLLILILLLSLLKKTLNRTLLQCLGNVNVWLVV